MKTSESCRYLSVTIDTEEEGLWSGVYSPAAAVTNIEHIPPFQSLCDRHGIRPTYLITTPVADSNAAVGVLRPIQDSDRCEIGTHVHPWNSPPQTSENTQTRDSFLCNLAPELQHAKIAGLTDLIERQFGRRPISFRAGRYGMSSAGIKSLRELGYHVDSSVIPFTSYESQGGPDFREARLVPYYPSSESILRGGGDASLLEVPVTVGFTHRHFEVADRIRNMAMKTPFRQARAVGVLDRSGIAQRLKLSPEQATAKQMQKLAGAVAARETPTLVLMFHSSSLKPSCSPYVRDEAALRDFLTRMDHFFRFCLDDLGYQTVPLGELRDRLAGKIPT